MAENVIKSDLEVLKGGTAKISSVVTSAEVAGGYSKDFYGSTTKCPSKEPTLIDIYLTTCKELFQKISEEMVKINEIGEGFATMDNFMKNTANTLNMQIKSIALTGITANTYETKDDINLDEIDKKINDLAEEKGIDLNLDDLIDTPTDNNVYTGGSGSHSSNEEDDYEEEIVEVPSPVNESVQVANSGVTPIVNNDKKDSKASTLENKPSFEKTIEPSTLEFVDNENPFADLNPNVPEINTSVEDTIASEPKASPYGAASIVAGIGLATGAAAYGTNKYINDKKDKDKNDEDDYDYEKDSDYAEGSDDKW